MVKRLYELFNAFDMSQYSGTWEEAEEIAREYPEATRGMCIAEILAELQEELALQVTD